MQLHDNCKTTRYLHNEQVWYMSASKHLKDCMSSESDVNHSIYGCMAVRYRRVSSACPLATCKKCKHVVFTANEVHICARQTYPHVHTCQCVQSSSNIQYSHSLHVRIQSQRARPACQCLSKQVNHGIYGYIHACKHCKP